jgi:hypothetical protein
LVLNTAQSCYFSHLIGNSIIRVAHMNLDYLNEEQIGGVFIVLLSNLIWFILNWYFYYWERLIKLCWIHSQIQDGILYWNPIQWGTKQIKLLIDESARHGRHISHALYAIEGIFESFWWSSINQSSNCAMFVISFNCRVEVRIFFQWNYKICENSNHEEGRQRFPIFQLISSSPQVEIMKGKAFTVWKIHLIAFPFDAIFD